MRLSGRFPGVHAEVRMHGFVKDLAPLYRHAMSPLSPCAPGAVHGSKFWGLRLWRAGGVTRLGAEGIDAADGVHLLFADNAEAFARACLRIKEAPEFAARPAAHAADLLHFRLFY
jgi:hypothetical protein